MLVGRYEENQSEAEALCSIDSGFSTPAPLQLIAKRLPSSIRANEVDMQSGSSSTLPEPGSIHYLSKLYAYVSANTSSAVDRHVFTCVMFCLIGRGRGQARHLLLRTQRSDIPRLRDMVLNILVHVLGLSTRAVRLRSTSSPETLIDELLNISPSDIPSTFPSLGYSRSRKGSQSHLKPDRRKRSSSAKETRPISASMRLSSTSTSGDNDKSQVLEILPSALPEALLLTSLGRAGHDTQETLWSVLRQGRVTKEDIIYDLAEGFFVVSIHDIRDGKEMPKIAKCLLDRFAFSSYVDLASPVSPKSGSRRSGPVIPQRYLVKLACWPLPAISPYLDVYLSNLLSASAQHPLLSAYLSPRARSDFYQFTQASAALFSDERKDHYATQEDAARVYVHVAGHRSSVRFVGEGVMGILERTAVPLRDAEDGTTPWRAGIKRRETVAEILREILSAV